MASKKHLHSMKRPSPDSDIVFQVKTEDCLLVWPRVAEFLEEALTRGLESSGADPDYDIGHIQNFVISGQWMLIVVVDKDSNIKGALTVAFIDYPLSRVAFITSIGGKMILSKDHMTQLNNVLREAGATKIQGMARKSIARLSGRLGFSDSNRLVERSIK